MYPTSPHRKEAAAITMQHTVMTVGGRSAATYREIVAVKRNLQSWD
jgi:hypothetical protein